MEKKFRSYRGILFLKFFGFFVCTAMLVPLWSFALEFNPNNLLTDTELDDASGLSFNRVETFLRAKGGALADYVTLDLDGKIRSAAEIIYRASNKHDINPKFVIATLQKESSLVTSGTVTSSLLDWAMGYGVCDGCSKDNPLVKAYKGFAKQIDSGLDRIRNGYLKDLQETGESISGWGTGISKQTLDGITITPENNATAVLYTYTPWVGYHGGDPSVGGNSLFWDIYTEWFPRIRVRYPNGSLLQDSYTGTVYLIKDSKKFAFSSRVALLASYDPRRVIAVDPSVLDLYEAGGNIRFPNYTLLRSPKGTVYLYSDGMKRGITSSEVFRSLGFNPEEILDVQWGDVSRIPDGEPITEEDAYVAGALLQDQETGGIYYISSDLKRHPIWSDKIFESRFSGRSVRMVSPKALQKFPSNSPVKFAEGTLVTLKRGSSPVYVIAHGQKRPFVSKKVFDKMGYEWSTLLYVDQNILDLHPTGRIISMSEKE